MTKIGYNLSRYTSKSGFFSMLFVKPALMRLIEFRYSFVCLALRDIHPIE